MIELQLDLGQFKAWAEQIGDAQDQVPYALSQALNKAAFDARKVWSKTPGHHTSSSATAAS